MKAKDQQAWLVNQIQDKRQYDQMVKMKEKIEGSGDLICAVTGNQKKWDDRYNLE